MHTATCPRFPILSTCLHWHAVSGTTKGPARCYFYKPRCSRFSISKSMRRQGNTITLHPSPGATNCFQWEEKSAHSSCDFGQLLRSGEMGKQWPAKKQVAAPFFTIEPITIAIDKKPANERTQICTLYRQYKGKRNQRWQYSRMA